ncbi:hypothetical protein I79_026110 [Cricetulus griseus]|uniref:Uncharacterized protein n=1 Tax=Cricetulus griseus TaxID=10029 RepID=G3IQ22_CRIGR|nr:hypothetical protein I79_026110 [Cricetulus griseus]
MTWNTCPGDPSRLIQSARVHFKTFNLPILHPCHRPSQLLPDDWDFGQTCSTFSASTSQRVMLTRVTVRRPVPVS